MKIKWLRIYRKMENRAAMRNLPVQNPPVKPICNYQDNYYGDQVCRLQ